MKNIYTRFFLTLFLMLTGLVAFAQPQFEINNKKDPCGGSSNGSFEVLVTSADRATFLYVFGERDGNPISGVPITRNVPFLVDRMAAGNIFVVVSYSNGSASNAFLTLVNQNEVIIDNHLVTHNSCTGEPDGKIELTLSGGTSNFLFSLDNGITFVDHPIVGLKGGDYIVTVIDAGTNCTAQLPFNIDDQLSVTVTNPTAFCANENSNLDLRTLVAPSIQGGEYTFTGQGVTGNIFDPSAITVAAGSGSETVSIGVQYEINGCEATGTINIEVKEVPDPPTLNGTINPVCQDRDAPVVNMNGTHTILIYSDADLTQQVGTGTSFDPETDPAFSTATPRTFNYYAVQELNGCTSEPLAFSVEVVAKPNAEFAANSIGVCEGDPASLTVNLMGQQPFSLIYSINGGENISVANINSNQYSIPLGKPTANLSVELVSVSDRTNCDEPNLSETATVTFNARPLASIAPIAALCSDAPAFSLTNGSFTGNPNDYTFAYNGPGVSFDGTNYIFTPSGVTPDQDHEISYTVTNVLTACDTTLLTSIRVNAIPEVTLPAFQNICVNADAPLVLNGGLPADGVYSSESQGISLVNGVYQFDPSLAGVGTHVIRYTYTDGNTCSSFVEQEIVVDPVFAMEDLVVTITEGSATVCEGDEVTLTATVRNAGANATYQWFVDNVSVKNSTDNFLSYIPENGDNVHVVVSQGDDVNCGAGGTISSENVPQPFTVLPLPTLTLNSNTTSVCSKEEFTFSATFTGVAPFTVVFNDGTQNQTIVVDSYSEITTISPEETTTYTLISVEDQNCINTNVSGQTITIEVIDPRVPAITALNNSGLEICEGGSVTFTAEVQYEGANPSYEWYVNKTLRETTTGPSFTLENASHEDSVYVRLIPGALQCSTLEPVNSDTFKIDVQTIDATITGPASFCLAQESATYVPSFITDVENGTFSVSRNGSDVSAMISAAGVFTPTQAGIYEITYTYTSQRQCTDSKSLTVDVTPIDEMTVVLNSPDALTSCEGTNLFAFSVTLTNEGDNPTIRWFVDGVEQTGAANQRSFTASNLVQRSAPYVVSVEVVQDAASMSCGNGAQIERSQNINVYPTPTAELVTANPTICANDNVQLTFNLSGTGLFNLTYTDGAENFVLNGISENPLTVTHQLTSDRKFRIVSFSDASGCPATISGEVNVKVNPTEALANLQVTSSDDDNTVCAGEQVRLTATVQNAGANATYEWFVDNVSVKNSTDNFLSYIPENGDNVHVVVSQGDDVNCGAGGTISSETTPREFTVNPLPIAEISSNVPQVCKDESAVLTFTITTGTATEENPFIIVYSDGTSEHTIRAASNKITENVSPAVTTTYTILSIADANCSQEITGQFVRIEVVENVVPAITALNNSGLEICEGGSVTFTAEVQYEGANPSYEWYVNKTLRETTTGPSFTLENASHEDSVYVRLIPGALQCSTLKAVNSDTFKIDVQTIDAAITGPANFCLAQGSATYVPSFITDVENGTFSVNRNGSDVSAMISAAGVFTPAEAGTYEITYTYISERNCTDSKSLTVVVRPTEEMTVVLNSPNTLSSCEGTNPFAFSVTLTNEGDNPAIRWFVDGVEQTGAANQRSFTVSNLAQRTAPYVVGVEVVQDASTVSCGNGDPIVRSQDINVYPTPTAELITANPTICANDNVQLTFNFSGTGLFNLTYTDGAENFVLNGISENPLTVTHQLTSDRKFRIVSFSDASGCPATISGEVNVTVNSLPAAPANLEASAVDCGDANVSWNAVTAATSYRLRIASDAEFANILRDVNVTELSYRADDLGATATYYFEVTSVNDCGTSTERAVISREIPNTAPLVPTNVVVSDEKCDGFVLSWDAMLGATSYELQLSTDESFTALVAGYDPFSSSENRQVLTDLQSTNYYLRLRTINSCGISEYSPVVAVDLTDNAPEEATARIEFEQNSCQSTVYTVFAVTTNTGNSPTYAWFRNELPVGTNSNRLDLNEYSEGDIVRVVVTPDQSSDCVLAEPAVDNHTIALPWTTAPIIDPEEITVCSGQTPVVSATGVNISWYLNEISEAGFLNVGTSPNYSSTSAETVNLIATQKIGECLESKGDTVRVIVQGPTAAPVLPADITRCSNDALPEVTAEGENIVWYADAALTRQINTGNRLELTSLRSSAEGVADTNFYATQTVNGCASSSEEIKIRTYQSPVLNLPSQYLKCFPDSAKLYTSYKAIDGYRIEWGIRGQILESDTIYVKSTSEVTVTVTNLETNCAASSNSLVMISTETVYSKLEIRKHSTESCGNEPLRLEAYVDNIGVNPTYEWFRNGIKLENDTLSILDLRSYGANDSISVVVNLDLTCANENPLSDYIKLSLPTLGTPSLATSSASVCVGEANPVLTASNFVEGSVLRWYLGSVAPENEVGGNSSTYTPEVTAAGTYTYFVTQTTERCGTSEAGSVSFTISDDPNCEPLEPVCDNPPVVALGEDQIRCEPASVTLDAGYNPEDGYLIEWKKSLATGGFEAIGDNTRMLEVNSTADYIAKVTQLSSGCSDADTVKVTITNSISNITVEVKALDALSCGTASLRLEAQLLVDGQPYDFESSPTYTWFKGTEQLQTTTKQIELTSYFNNEVYSVVISHNQSCTAAEQPATVRGSYTIQTPALAAPSVQRNSYTICFDEGGPQFRATSGSNWRWYRGSVATGNLVAQNVDRFTPADTEVGAYSYFVTQSTDRCGESTATEINFTIQTQEDCNSNGFNCGVFTATLTDFREPSCGRKNGEMHYQIGGGTAPYFVRYSFSEKLLEQTRAEATFMLDITEIPAADTVRIFVRDARGRECSLKNVLEMAPQLKATFTKAPNGDVSCYGEKIGKATLKVEGNPPFQYMLSEEEGWVNMLGNTKEFTNLSAGINSILVRQNEGDQCFASAEVEILSLNPPMDITRFETEKANCNDNIGRILIHEITGGMGTYKLKLSHETSFRNFTPGTPFVFEKLARGLHTVIVSDGVCEFRKEIRVGSPGLIVVEQPRLIPFSCDNPFLKAGIEIKVKGTNEQGGSEVVGPYLVAISKMNSAGEYVVIPGMEALEVDPNFNILQKTGLDNGTYAVEIRTASREGCPENVKGMVINSPEMPVPITFTYSPVNMNCEGSIGGVVVRELSGAIQKEFTISVYQNNELVQERTISRDEYLVNKGTEGVYQLSNLGVGIYRMLITQEQGGCEGLESSDPVSFRVEEKALKLTAEVVRTTESFPDRGSGSLTFTVRTNSGKEPYTSSIYLVEPLFPGQHYESKDDQVIYDPIETTFALTYKDMPAGNYELYIVDANGCDIMLTATVGHDKNVFVPNVITPNGDGVNEKFYIRNIPDTGTRLTITNRWGKVVFITEDYRNNWSGGDEPDGIYFYHLRIMGGERKELKGWLEIRRGSRP